MLFKLPLLKRSIVVPGKGCNRNCSLRTIRGNGVFVFYAKPWQNSWLYLMKQPIEIRQTYCLIEARDITSALRIFYRYWQGAKTGGREPEQKALFIDSGKAIIGCPPCSVRNINKRGEYMCGPEDLWNPDCGLLGMCCIHGFDYPLDTECPIAKLIENRQPTTIVYRNIKIRYVTPI